MPRREASPPKKNFAFDLLANWGPYAAIPERSDASFGWPLYGTVTKRGRTYGLAWRRGMTAACTEHGQILELSALKRCQISMGVTFEKPRGWDGVPKSTGDHYYGNGTPFSR
jgi:hypothetical protein